MESGRMESLTLVAAVIGAATLESQAHTLGFGAAAIGDIAILLALFAFDAAADRGGAGSLAFGGVAAYCLLTPFDFFANTILGASISAGTNHWTIWGLWIFLALVLFAVDRFRMSSRDNVGLAVSGTMAGTGPLSVGVPAPAYRPAPIRVEPVASVPPPPPFQPPPPVTAEPPAPPHVYVPSPELPFETPNFAAPPAEPVPPAPPANVMPIPTGREALIYINLVGEGLNVLRTVRAENLGRDYFRIADVMPEGEQWEFTPGMVVRCRKRALSNGKQLVAYEEAPRAV